MEPEEMVMCWRRKTHSVRWLMISLFVLPALACGFSQAPLPTPAERIVRVTQIVAPTVVEVTRIVQARPIVQTLIVEVQGPAREVTRLVEVVVEAVQTSAGDGARIKEVTRIVPVTRLVQASPAVITVLVERSAPQSQLPAPAPTLAPAPTAVPAPTSAPQQPNRASPVWYDFEGDFLATGVVIDRSGNGHDARVVGSVGVTGGILGGQAILFDGSGYIQAQGNPVAGKNRVSFSLWFKTDHPEENYKLASAAWWNWGPGSGWILATHIPEFWSIDTNTLYLPGLTNNDNLFQAGEWVHEVVTYDGERIKEYTNGKLVNDWATSGAAIGDGQAMAIGAWPAFQAYNFQGSMDEFRIFDRALTQQEALAIYNQR
jgi:hypothetical protein